MVGEPAKRSADDGNDREGTGLGVSVGARGSAYPPYRRSLREVLEEAWT